MRLSVVAALIFAALIPAEALADTFHALVRFDANADGELDESELTSYFEEKGNKDAEDRAGDLLTRFCDDCVTIPISKAAEVLARGNEESVEPKRHVGACRFLSIKRTVADEVDPRAAEGEFPSVFSYKRDTQAEDRDQINVLGAVEAFDCARDGGDPKILNITYGAAMGVDFDVDGSVEANENTIEASLPLFWQRVSIDPDAFVTQLKLTVTPKFNTDRDFDREVVEGSAALTFQSRRLLRLGLKSHLRSGDKAIFSVWWQPVVQFEVGDIGDPAGNEDLAEQDGQYSRLALRGDLILWPVMLSDRVAIKLKSTNRFNADESGSRSYTEATLAYDLTASGSVALTAVYRHGRKPPDFSVKDQWLIGIGIQR